ncbi:hypothetical protein AALP_AA8G433000 [Arabis alpina]|uniref:DDT domain-containing protein DDR4 n=1 Tax=Arabis alpina TaxID=50452 RepID=A0A087GD59_ARAAL|nr:hypothetical protein AALP_AA8G433000 [Arabis alpina]
MVMLRRRTTAVTGETKAVVEVKKPDPVVEEKVVCDDKVTIVVDTESAVKDLRGRWELASVLNFVNVFGPLVSEKMKLTAEEIEMGLIECNVTNVKLHVALLKGILPVNKMLDEGEAWITVLCKKLAPWWPWIATGEIPITANKGEEIAEYKGLDPITRLEFLKALCELRVQQDDARKYIQENANEGAVDSRFCKRKLGGDGKNTSYWFDGNDIQGYRLYREVNEISKSAKSRKNACSDISCFSWEIEATNLDEFQKVAKELSSSKASSLAAIGEKIETDAVPVVEKYHKKKEMAIKRKMKKEKAVNVNFTRLIRTTRSCRNRMPATYTFDEYDRMIDDAVEESMETDQDDEEEEEQQSGSMGSDDGSEGDNDNEKENVESKEDTEPKGELKAKKMLTERPMNELNPLLV